MAAVDSAAVFAERCVELGISNLEADFERLGWASFGNFAYAIPTSAAGSFDDGLFREKVLARLFNINADAEEPKEGAVVRRLFCESIALATQALRSKMDRTDADPPRRIPQAERDVRKTRLDARLGAAIEIKGDLEPANCLVDRFAGMLDDRRVEYVEWASCATRKAEMQAGPARKRFFTEHNGLLKVNEVKDDPTVNATTLFDISLALQRRGLAAELAGLMSYEAHETIRNRLVKALRDTPRAAGYQAPPVSQVREADVFIWEQIGQRCGSGLRPQTSADPLPADVAVKAILGEHELAIMLMPLPVGSGAARAKAIKAEPDDETGTGLKMRGARGGKAKNKDKDHNKDNSKDNRIKELERDLAAARAGGGRASGSGGGGKGKGGDGKGKRSDDKGGKGGTGRVPAELEPGVGKLPDGTPLCFGFNLGRCDAARSGHKCARGLHACTRPGCGGNHRALDCTR